MTVRIRVELLGGLGNQLFQAAAGMSLARRLGGELIFDVSRLRLSKTRSFALDGFQHGARIYAAPVALSRAYKLLKTIGIGSKRPWDWRGAAFEEASYAYDARFAELSGDCMLRGYFQSPKYFHDHAHEVRRVFDPARLASNEAKKFATAMGSRALAVHVRAGDYSANPKIAAFHGTLPSSYYQEALARAKATGAFDRIFVFSDSPAAARALLAEEQACEFVDGFSAIDDFFLMSRAHGHVIANSTFSWWSAWLDPRPDAVVIAPRAWFSEAALKTNDISDLYPPHWTLL